MPMEEVPSTPAMAAGPVSPVVETITLTLTFLFTAKWFSILHRNCCPISLNAYVGP